MIIKFYLKEIKNRFILVTFCWLLTFITCFINREALLYISLKPSFKYKKSNLSFIITDAVEILYSCLHISYLISNTILLGFLLYHLALFIIPGLHYNEKIKLKIIFYQGLFFFYFFIILFYNVALPQIWRFFNEYLTQMLNIQHIVHFQPKLIEYVNMVSYTYMISGLFTQCLFFITIYLKISKNSELIIKNNRKFFYFLLLILITCITPPDVNSQIILTFLTFCLIELIIFNHFFLSIILKNNT